MSSAVLIDGKAIAARLREKIGAAVSKLQEQHQLTPGLAVVLVGEDPASQVYVRNKARQTKEAGMASFEHRLSAQISEAELLKLIDDLNADPSVHGILVQLPLPDHINEELVIAAINPEKDVDGFHPINVGRLAVGAAGLVPCTPLGCVILAKSHLQNLTGLNAVVVGRSNIVGKPVAQLLLQQNCTVTIAHSRTKEIEKICANADLLVAAIGRPQMIKANWVKPGATLIDVGINRIDAPEKGIGKDGKVKTRLVGDIDFAEAQAVAGAITPVPGGVGPMTIACLLRNSVQAACAQHNVALPDLEPNLS